MKRVRLTYNSTVRDQREEWARFESEARELVTVEDSGLGVLTVLLDADSDAGVLGALRPVEAAAGRHGISELRVTGEISIPVLLEPTALAA